MKYVFILLVAVQLSASAASKTPEAATEAFYQWVLSHHVAGLPSPAQRQQLRGLLTPAFAHALEEAVLAQDRCVAGLPPDMKGDIWEGSLFVSNYEGASEAWYGEKQVHGRDVTIEVNLFDVDPSRPKGDWNRTITWRDAVRLRRQNEGWVVADVMRGDSSTSGERKSLVGMLREYIDVDCPRKPVQRPAERAQPLSAFTQP